MSAKRLNALAALSGLKRTAKGPWGGPAVAGSLQGFPVAVAWTRTDRQAAVSILVRFAKGSWTGGPDGLKGLAEGSEPLRAAFGKSVVPKAVLKRLTLLDDGVLLTWPFSFFSPKAEQAFAVLQALVGLVARVAKPVAGSCEGCGRETREGLWLADGVPSRICGGCRQSQDAEALRLMEAYDRLESNPLLGLLYGLAAAALLAGLWGGVAYALNRIFLWGAIGIGVALAWAVNKGMAKVNLFGRILTVLLTVGTVLAGDYLFILLTVAKEAEGGLSLGLAQVLASRFWQLEFAEASGAMSLLFGLVGAGYVLYANRPPRFQVRYEPLG